MSEFNCLSETKANEQMKYPQIHKNALLEKQSIYIDIKDKCWAFGSLTIYNDFVKTAVSFKYKSKKC